MSYPNLKSYNRFNKKNDELLKTTKLNFQPPKGLAVAKILMGVIAVILGSNLIGMAIKTEPSYQSKQVNNDTFIFGCDESSCLLIMTSMETACGIVVILTGIFNICTADGNTSRCVRNTYLVIISLVIPQLSGWIFIFVLTVMSDADFSTNVVVLSSLLHSVLFVSTIALGVEASVCCRYTEVENDDTDLICDKNPMEPSLPVEDVTETPHLCQPVNTMHYYGVPTCQQLIAGSNYANYGATLSSNFGYPNVRVSYP